jgi:hypothetical protein
MNVMDDADHAKRLLDDELLQRVLSNMVSDLQLRWLQTDPADTDLREQLYDELQGVKKFGESLKTFYDRGLFMQKKR